MTCDICFRSANSRLPFYCPTCARSHLYELRIENARVLLERSSIGRQIEDVIKCGSLREGVPEPDVISSELGDGAPRRWALQAAASRQAESAARVRALSDRVKFLKAEIKDKQTDMSQRKANLCRRRSDAESAKYQLTEREDAVLANIQNVTKRTDHLWHSLHSKTAEARIFLCREAANLYGLGRKVVDRDGSTKEVYIIGGVPIIDLREMNSAQFTQISTALANVAHLLVLVSHYLSLRLPAETILAHRNYATAAIYAPSASYAPMDNRSQIPRPRPLFVSKNLTKLAKEDPGTYNLFLEGATLLAWNISWLCRTQGLSLSSDSWEEVCNMGKNLWQLLVASPSQPLTLARAFAGRDVQSKLKATKGTPKTSIQRTMSFPMLGHYSHGTAHSFLGASEGTEFMRTWKLPGFTKVADKLKLTLLGEMASAEWELLEKTEWDDSTQEQHQSSPSSQPPDQESTLVQRSWTEKDDASHLANVSVEAAGQSNTGEGTSSSGRQKGTSGWMKLRSR